MALIQCPECDKEVSDKAPACPSCGVPIYSDRESRGSGVTNLVTTQETSKSLKFLLIIAFGLMVIGVLWIYGSYDLGWGAPAIPVVIFLSGLSLWIGTKIRIWWHHG